MNLPESTQMFRAPFFHLFSGERVGNLDPQSAPFTRTEAERSRRTCFSLIWRKGEKPQISTGPVHEEHHDSRRRVTFKGELQCRMRQRSSVPHLFALFLANGWVTTNFNWTRSSGARPAETLHRPGRTAAGCQERFCSDYARTRPLR
jgi:hypothetical protein